MHTDLLRTLATNFGSNSVLAAKAIREMYVLDPAGFPPAVEEVLRGGADLPGASFMMALLVADPLWLRGVCDPRKYSLDQTIELLQRARKLDPRIEFKLASMLAELKFTAREDGAFAGRVLDILERGPNSTALPALRQISHSRNPNLRSKAVLLIGRIIRNPQWANQVETEEDPRVFANATESLWGMDSAAAREAFFRASRDKYHRVAANGMVGLYRMADPHSIPLLFQLGRSEKPLGRAAAAWAMGHLEDPRFLPALAKLMEDSEERVRKGAFASMARVRQKMKEMRAAGTLRVEILEAECRGGSHTVRFRVMQEEKFVSGFDLRRFVPWNGPDLVEEFYCFPHEGTSPNYEISFQAPPSATHLVKVQVYAASGVGEDTGFETTA